MAAIELRAHGHEDEAMKLLDEAIRWYESQPPERRESDTRKNAYAVTLYQARRWDKAKDVREEFAKRFPRDSANGRGFAVILGLIAARQGDRAKAMEVSDWLKNLKEPYLYGWPSYQRACIAAILGDNVGYWFGKKTGSRIFSRDESLLFRRKNLLAPQTFYERHGGTTIVLARFMPFIRTFAPIVAGAVEMPFRRCGFFPSP